MRILLINDLNIIGGGAEKVVFDTKKLLEEKGHIVKILGSGEKENISSFFSRWFSLKYYFLTKKIIKEFKPDIVHCHNLSRIISPSPIVAAKKMRKIVILTLHDFHMYCPKTWGIFQDGRVCEKGYNLFCPFYNCYTFKRGRRYIFYHFLKWLKVSLHRKIIKNYVDYFICPSEKLKEFTQRSLNIPEKTITHLSNFIEISDNYKVDFSRIKNNQFLFVGRISKEKGIDVLIKTVNSLVRKDGLRDVKIKIIGDGSERKSLEESVKKLGLEENIEFLGRIPNEKLSRHYQESLAVIMPSVCMENCPIVALEAMANHTPIIATNIGGFPDLIEHNKNGYLFEMGNYEELAVYMKKLSYNIELSKKLGDYGFEKVKREFNKEKYYGKLMKIYHKKKRVGLLVLEEFNPKKIGGFGFVAKKTSELLSELDKDVFLLNLSKSSNGVKKSNVGDLPIYFLKRKVAFPLNIIEEILATRRLIKISKKLKLDVILCISEWLARYCYYIKPFLPNLKTVLWLQDTRTPEDIGKISTLKLQHEIGECISSNFGSLINEKINSVLTKKGILSVDKIVTQAKLISDKVSKIYHINTDHFVLLANPIKIPSMELIKTKKPTIVFLGRLDPIKRPWIFCELAKKFPGIDFLVLGSTHYPALMNPILNKYSKINNLHFLGLVTGERKHKILSNAWILVNTSVYESLPVSFLEALSYKISILSCQNPDSLTSKYGYFTGEILGEGNENINKFVEGLNFLLNNNRWRSLGNQGYEFVKNFADENKVKKQLEKILDNL